MLKNPFQLMVIVLLCVGCGSTQQEELITTPVIVEPTETSSPQLPSFIEDEFGVPMIKIPAGEFFMGSDRVDDAFPHTVYLDDYYIDQFEVTNALFAEFLNEFGNQLDHKKYWVDEFSDVAIVFQEDGDFKVDPGFEDHPIVEVTWYGANAFCEWRGGKLPTEAQWEKAARGSEGLSPFPWGKGISCEQANYDVCGLRASLPVNSNPEGVSPYGVYNMAGNVGEWTADWYGGTYYEESPYENPQGPEEPSPAKKSSRGGSWFSTSNFLRVYHRNHEFSPTDSFSNVGFRCVFLP